MTVEFGVHRDIGTAEQLNKLVTDLGPKQRAVAVAIGDRQWGVRVVPTPNSVVAFINRLSGQSWREQQGLKALEQRLSAVDMEAQHGSGKSASDAQAPRLSQHTIEDGWVGVFLASPAKARLLAPSTATIKSGIQNLGVDCYANASIQFLRACGDQMLGQAWASCSDLNARAMAETDEGRKAHLRKEHTELLKGVQALESLLRDSYAGNRASERANRHVLYEMTGMAEKSSGASRGQEDVHEFMITLLDKLKIPSTVTTEEVLTKHKAGFDPISNTRSSSEQIPLVDLPTKSSNMQEVFNQWLAPHTDERVVHFDSDNVKLGPADSVSQHIQLSTLPEQFMVSLKRFVRKDRGYSEGFDKNRQSVDVVQAVSLKDKHGQSATFQPVAVIRHSGLSINSGHYTCYRQIENQWYFFDDAEPAKPVTEGEVRNNTRNDACVIQYRKVLI